MLLGVVIDLQKPKGTSGLRHLPPGSIIPPAINQQPKPVGPIGSQGRDGGSSSGFPPEEPAGGVLWFRAQSGGE